MDTCLQYKGDTMDAWQQGQYYGHLITRMIVLWTYKDDIMDTWLQGWYYGHLATKTILWTIDHNYKDDTLWHSGHLQGSYRSDSESIQFRTIFQDLISPFSITPYTMNALYISHYRRYTYTGRSSKTTSALWAKGEMELAGGGSRMTSAHRDRPTDQAPTKGDSLILNCFAGWPLMVAKGQACNTVS